LAIRRVLSGGGAVYWRRADVLQHLRLKFRQAGYCSVLVACGIYQGLAPLSRWRLAQVRQIERDEQAVHP